MTIHYQGHGVTLHHGDCLDVLRTLPDASVDSVVTDPPYGLEFMGKEWDKFGGVIEPSTDTRNRDGNWTTPPFGGGGQRVRYGASPGLPFQEWCEAWATECLRVLKPGGHLLAFGGTRTWHRLACAVEDAGFEVRDSIAWMYGSGFPKSLDVSKAIDKLDATDERRTRALRFTEWMRSTGITSRQVDEATGTNMGGHYLTAESQPAVATVAHLDALRPLLPDVPEWVEGMARQRTVESLNYAARPITQAEVRPLASGEHITFDQRGSKERERRDIPTTPDAERWQGWGTALKPAFEPVVVARKPLSGTVAQSVLTHGTGALNIDACRIGDGGGTTKGNPPKGESNGIYGNGINGACDIVDLGKGRWPANVVLDESQAEALDEQSGTLTSGANPTRRGSDKFREAYGDFKGQAECDPARGADAGGASRFFYVAKADATERPRVNGTAHPTVKPLSLMRWLVRLVTPPGGTILEPFSGSGTTVEACLIEGFNCIAIEKTDEYLPLTVARIHRQRNPVEAVRLAGDDLGLFAHIDDEVSA